MTAFEFDKRLTCALLLSLLIHALLLCLIFGDQKLWLPTFRFPWLQQRIAAPDLRVVLVPAPIKASASAVPSVAEPVQQATVEQPAPSARAPAPSRAPTAEHFAAAIVRKTNPEPDAKPSAATATDAAFAGTPSEANRLSDVEPASIAVPDVIALKRIDEPTWRIPATPEMPAPTIAAAPSASIPQSTTPPLLSSSNATLARIESDGAVELTKLDPTKQIQQQTEQLAAALQETTQQEAALREAARQEAAQQEAAREAARREAALKETARQEAAREDIARQEAAQEAARQEAARQDIARQEAAQEAARQEAARQDIARQEAAQEAARQEAARQEIPRQEVAQEAARQEAPQQQAARQEVAGGEVGREASRQAVAQQEAQRQEAARAEVQEAQTRREARLRGIGRQLDEEAARRDAATTSGGLSPPPSWSPARRYRLFGRSDSNAEIIRYAEAWERKIQLNMTFDMVREAVKQPHSDPLVTVAIRSDGSVEKVTFVQSSGVPAIDDAIRSIVDSQKPYQAFPPTLASDYDVIEIRRTWYFDMAIRLH